MITFSFSGQDYHTGRIIGNIEGSKLGPVVMFIAGIHGNEPSGVLALQEVFDELESAKVQLNGRLVGVTGNLNALSQNERFISKDLNRIWNRDFLDLYRSKSGFDPTPDRPESNSAVAEQVEQVELYQLIEPIMSEDRPSFFLDLHTTSAPSVPFIAINDQLNNRSFALQFAVPTVLGIEEFLEGPLLSYLNEFGPVALAFEAGQHDDPESVKTHKSFIYQAMVVAGLIAESKIPGQSEHRLRLERLGKPHHDFFEVLHRHSVSSGDDFAMKPGYKNLTPVKKGEVLAHDRDGEVNSPMTGLIFMPLYQPSGDDGFFIVRKVPTWALKLSSVLRKINFDRFLVLLPGVAKSLDHPDALIVNKRVARFLAKQIFHLLGYRRKQEDGDSMIFSRREIA